MNVEEAHKLDNNLDVREPRRKYYPQHAMIAVDIDGEIGVLKKY